MKPFNLEQALAGHPVCTRDGWEVTQLVNFDCINTNPLRGVVNAILREWDEKGLSGCADDLDLFMAPIKKTGWVARHSTFIGGYICKTEAEAKNCYPKAISYHEISWEE